MNNILEDLEQRLHDNCANLTLSSDTLGFEALSDLISELANTDDSTELNLGSTTLPSNDTTVVSVSGTGTIFNVSNTTIEARFVEVEGELQGSLSIALPID